MAQWGMGGSSGGVSKEWANSEGYRSLSNTTPFFFALCLFLCLCVSFILCASLSLSLTLSLYLSPSPPLSFRYPPDQAAVDRRLSKERLLELIPEQLATVLTSSVVKGGADKLHGLLQCPVMTKNVLYTLVDMLLLRLFEQEHDKNSFPVEGLYNIRSTTPKI